jgi:hypothetical protein
MWTMYDYVQHMEDLAAWYRHIVDDLYPPGPDQGAKSIILDERDRAAERARTDPSPAAGVAAVQWNRATIFLADAERDAGRPGWRPEWDLVYEYYCPGNDMLLGPYGPAGP